MLIEELSSPEETTLRSYLADINLPFVLKDVGDVELSLHDAQLIGAKVGKMSECVMYLLSCSLDVVRMKEFLVIETMVILEAWSHPDIMHHVSKAHQHRIKEIFHDLSQYYLQKMCQHDLCASHAVHRAVFEKTLQVVKPYFSSDKVPKSAALFTHLGRDERVSIQQEREERLFYTHQKSEIKLSYWKWNPGITFGFLNMLLSIDHSSVTEPNLAYILPILLCMLDDWQPKYKLLASNTLAHLMPKIPPALISHHHWDGVLEEALLGSLFFDPVELARSISGCLVILYDLYYKPLQYQKYRDSYGGLMSIFIKELLSAKSFKICSQYIDIIMDRIEEDAIAHFHKWLKYTDMYIEQPCLEMEDLERILTLLTKFMQWAWPRIRSSSQEVLVFLAKIVLYQLKAKSWTACDFRDSRVGTLWQGCFKLLLLLGKEDIKDDAQKLFELEHGLGILMQG